METTTKPLPLPTIAEEPAAAVAAATVPKTPATPALDYTCTCDTCREGFTNICLKDYPDALDNITDYGAGPDGNKRLEMYMQTLLHEKMHMCPCGLPEKFDEFDFEINEEVLDDPEVNEADLYDMIKEQFIKFYKDRTELEECETDECEFPDGSLADAECDFEGDYDYGQHLIDEQEAYYWAKGEEAAAAAASRRAYYGY
jgi:hypothetical protein